MNPLLYKETIAGAVARSILQGEQDPLFQGREGLAYKAAWDRKGSNALKHCDAFAADCKAAEIYVRFAPKYRPGFLLLLDIVSGHPRAVPDSMVGYVKVRRHA